MDRHVGRRTVLHEERARIAGEEAPLHGDVVRAVADRDAVVGGAGRRHVAEDDVVRAVALRAQVVAAVPHPEVADDHVVAAHLENRRARVDAAADQRRAVAFDRDERAAEIRQPARHDDRPDDVEAHDRAAAARLRKRSADRGFSRLRDANRPATRAACRRRAEALERAVVERADGRCRWRRRLDDDRPARGRDVRCVGDADDRHVRARCRVHVRNPGARRRRVARRSAAGDRTVAEVP